MGYSIQPRHLASHLSKAQYSEADMSLLSSNFTPCSGDEREVPAWSLKSARKAFQLGSENVNFSPSSRKFLVFLHSHLDNLEFSEFSKVF